MRWEGFDLTEEYRKKQDRRHRRRAIGQAAITATEAVAMTVIVAGAAVGIAKICWWILTGEIPQWP